MVNEALGLPYGTTIGGDHVMVPTRRLVDVHMIYFSSKKTNVAKSWGPFNV
jgi:hypothetical protein